MVTTLQQLNALGFLHLPKMFDRAIHVPASLGHVHDTFFAPLTLPFRSYPAAPPLGCGLIPILLKTCNNHFGPVSC